MTSPSPGRFAGHFEYGKPVAAPEGGIPYWDVFPYDGDVSVRALDAPVIPEPPRGGEGDRPCGECARDDEGYVWTDEHWRLDAGAGGDSLLNFMLTPRAHHDLGDLPADLVVGMGTTIQRVEAAIMGLGDIARVHVNRWGDGGSHLHWWFFARPEGLLQLRGTCLPLWGDVLPALPKETWDAAMTSVASHMTTTGGRPGGPVV
ncbi:hypothetical protein [Phytomonospora endophytica]|uniref:Uncharacterized protein n=1 Tax=Phytomonospora endophytica TaxID=714109 RepID=A0A841F5J5_9ACTN|nr:hypothetical protein [Phytomonospora endophytica]MBB6032181.1 hypothetical protein [Phytomonospora endophytica]GIG68530.1 hypothetical protein Pen01_48250 [Phytomonospora endophytica]